MNKNVENNKIIKILVIILLIVFLIGIIYGSINLFTWKNDSNKNKKVKNKINQYIEKEDKKETKIDFKKLKEINPDTVAYIKVNNTSIDYIVVKGNDNEYYLDHNFNKEYNTLGWIFMDYNNKFDDTDKNIIIYGHNTQEDSMFTSLGNTQEDWWQENIENREIELISENKKYKYQVFSTYTIIPEDYYIKTEFNSDEEYNNFINTLKERSNYDYGVDLANTSNILTLSSCNFDGTKRVVLHAKLISSEDNLE